MKRRFTAQLETTQRDLVTIIKKMGATSLQINQDILKGAVEIIFDREWQRYVFRCSKYPDALDNLRAAQLTITYLWRAVEEYGVTSEDFGRVAVADRRHAANNPAAHFYGKPITLEDHQASRWIVEPLHLLDCCQESDGAQALLVTTLERARDLRQPPAVIAAAAANPSSASRRRPRWCRRGRCGGRR